MSIYGNHPEDKHYERLCDDYTDSLDPPNFRCDNCGAVVIELSEETGTCFGCEEECRDCY